MKKTLLRVLSALLALLCLLPIFGACNSADYVGETSDTTSDTTTAQQVLEETTTSVDNGSLGAVSENGTLEWTLLGTRQFDSFAGINAADGRVLLVVYLEACNKSLYTQTVYRACLDTNIDPMNITEDKLPEPYSNFGGDVASGKRRLFCLCFDMEQDWFKLELVYDDFSNKKMDHLLMGKTYVEGAEMLQGNPDYPIHNGANALSDTQIQADFNILFDRYYSAQWGTPDEASADATAASLEKTDKGMRFTNIDYSSGSASAWDNANHLIYLKNLISAYGEARLKTDAAARETVLSVLDYWLNCDFKAGNWWYNEIQTPRYMAWIGIMIKPYLSEAQITKMDKIIGRGTPRGSSKAVTYTGANLSDMMATTIVHALFVDDPDLIFAAVARMSAEVVIAKNGDEGMQADGSYFQHGKLLCAAGSYGAVFIQGMYTFVTQLQGTCFQLPQSKIELFADHILDGQRYFHRGTGTAYFSIGRSAVYANGAGNLMGISRVLSQMEGVERAEELAQYRASFDDLSKTIDSHKFFTMSYVLVRTRPEYYMAVRGAHEDFILTEVVNRQNLLGYNLSYGANTCYMYYGDEYQAIGAVLDFAMFPGITTYHETDAQLLSRYDKSYAKSWGKSTYEGTHCDGVVDEEAGLGAMYMELKNDGITGKLSFITYDGGMIALGAGLDCSKSSNVEIRTSLDQCKLNGARVGDTALTVDGEDVTVTGNGAVYNGAFAYYNLGEGNLTASAKRMTGSYSRTDSAAAAVEQTADVFQLYIDHGKSLNNNSYAYAVVGNADGKAPVNTDGLPIKSITNTETVQAVEFTDGHYAVIFHSAGSHMLSSGEVVTATEAGIIIK
ncbi:MAG: hypothetical protein IJY27_03240 [Clostridia bacterium]|nr:hypothetical protein [Clostridia bacterium]